MSSAISWAFGYVDKLMILEDDCVPSQDFFRLCAELLEKYKDDERIGMISAMNQLGQENSCNESYFFCNSGAIWAWATWKRAWNTYDFNMDFVKELDIKKIIKTSNFPRYYKRSLLNQLEDRYGSLQKGQKLSSWTFQFTVNKLLHSQLCIVPTVNLMTNIGLTGDSTHASSSLKQIPKGLQSIFYMDAYPMTFPVSHPKYVYSNDSFDARVWKKLGMSFGIALERKIESIYRQFVYGDKRRLIKKLKNKMTRS